MNDRVNLGKANSEIYKQVIELDGLVTEAAKVAGLEEGFTHLLRLRASQINQCAFCIRLHCKDALDCGESMERISVLPAWKETEYFSQTERAGLSLVESITNIAVDQIPDTVYAEAATALSEEQIAAIEWLGVVINTWNRIAVSSRYVVK